MNHSVLFGLPTLPVPVPLLAVACRSPLNCLPRSAIFLASLLLSPPPVTIQYRVITHDTTDRRPCLASVTHMLTFEKKKRAGCSILIVGSYISTGGRSLGPTSGTRSRSAAWIYLVQAKGQLSFSLLSSDLLSQSYTVRLRNPKSKRHVPLIPM